jgi:hypothetical protein
MATSLRNWEFMNISDLTEGVGDLSPDCEIVVQCEGRRFKITSIAPIGGELILNIAPISKVKVEIKQIVAALCKTSVPIVRQALLECGERILTEAVHTSQINETDGQLLWEQLRGSDSAS